jgi:hypothetical protein
MFRDYSSAAGPRRAEAPRHHGSGVEERTAPPPRASTQPVLSRALSITSPAVAVSHPADPNEQEAERVADTLSSGCPGCHESRPCSTCADASTVHRASVPAGTEPGRAVEAPTGGRALDAGTRAWFEPRLGASLGGVRIHTDEPAAEAARHLRARAFTIGGHIGFGVGEYTPETAGGHRLLAHELAHVVQQSSGQGPAQGPTRPHHPPMLQRKPDEGAGSGESEEFDPEKERDSSLSGIDLLISLSDPKGAAFGLRLKLLFQASEPDWPDRAALDTFYEQCSKTARDEKATIGALGDPDRTDPEAFPTTWSGMLKQHLTMSYPLYLLQRDVEAAKGEMEKSGEDIPNYILEHGLPVGFGASLDLRAFQLSNVLGVSFAWTITPAGSVSVESGPLMAFITQALKYLRAVNEADSINLWIQGAQSVVKQVDDGELSVDPEAFDRYKDLRPLGVSWDEIKGSKVTFAEPLSGRIDPAVAERFVTSGAALMAFGRSFGHAKDVTTIANRFIGQADSRIAGEDPMLRQLRASHWGHENGFYLDAVKHELEDIKEHAVEIGAGMAKDVAVFTAIQFIPIVNVLADIYMGAQLISDVADTVDELASADQEARDAKTAAVLQRAAAHQAAALSSTARKVATAIVMHHATKLAETSAGKGHGRATKGEGDRAEPERARAPEDPAKLQERAKREAQERGAGQIASKFKELASVCELGSINCRFELPGQVEKEAGAYPTARGVPMPDGPFYIRRSILSGVRRDTEFLRTRCRENRKLWPDFDAALAAAEKKGLDWPTTGGVPWEVHHVKPVFMGGENPVGNLFPLPKDIHLEYTNWWNKVHRGFKRRFTDKEWEMIYGDEIDVPGSTVPQKRVR